MLNTALLVIILLILMALFLRSMEEHVFLKDLLKMLRTMQANQGEILRELRDHKATYKRNTESNHEETATRIRNMGYELKEYASKYIYEEIRDFRTTSKVNLQGIANTLNGANLNLIALNNRLVKPKSKSKPASNKSSKKSTSKPNQTIQKRKK